MAEEETEKLELGPDEVAELAHEFFLMLLVMELRDQGSLDLEKFIARLEKFGPYALKLGWPPAVLGRFRRMIEQVKRELD